MFPGAYNENRTPSLVHHGLQSVDEMKTVEHGRTEGVPHPHPPEH